MRTIRATGLVVVTVASIGLSACGWGGSDGGSTPSQAASDPAATPAPASLPSTVDGLVAFLKSLGADDTSEPAALGDQALPVDDAAEPQPLS